MISAIVLILAVLGVIAVAALFYLGQKSKSGTAPGLVDGALAACPGAPNCVVSEGHADEKHKIEPLPLSAWERIPNAVGDAGGTITQINEAYVSATFTSKTFGFVDDVEFRKSDNEVHVRSASRVGYSDRGVNRSRVEALRAALN